MEMDVDIRPLWTWNVKQIFVFIMAEYKGTVNVSTCGPPPHTGRCLARC